MKIDHLLVAFAFGAGASIAWALMPGILAALFILLVGIPVVALGRLLWKAVSSRVARR